MNTEILTDEQAALLWSGDTASLANLDTTTTTVAAIETTTDSTTTDDTVIEPIVVNDDDLNGMFADPEDGDSDDNITDNNDQQTNNSQDSTKPKGRKVSDLVSIVNQLIEEGSLTPFEDGEIKTIDDAKELINLNIKAKENTSHEEFWIEKISSYSPQIQAIIQYAEQGGKDATSLLSAISQIETTQTYDLDTVEGQEATVRDMLLEKGFDTEEAEDQISTLKETGKLEEKATKFKPQLDQIRGNRVQKMMEQQKIRQEQARLASDKYLETITNTLKKETLGPVKLKREDKSKIFNSLAQSNYTSLNGTPTNGFVKALENMQFGENADYEHFLNVVHLAIDKEAFYEKLRTEIKNEVTIENVRKLKESRTTTPNTEIDLNTNPQQRKNTIQRSTFKNPFG